jgi:excinuclease ABC subunit A
MDFIRRQFAQSEDARRHAMSAGDFSFNSAGACKTCDGKGEIEEDLFFLGEVRKQCPECAGSRFCSSSLRARWMGRNIAEWMSTTVDECITHWDPFPLVRKQLRLAGDLGLGYLPIGTPTSALSGGELQRLRIAAALSIPGKKMLCLLDEPTRGLSEVDIENLLDMLLRLTRLGHTFVIVEHHQRFCDKAHQLILMGPGGGKEGGQIVKSLVRNEISN